MWQPNQFCATSKYRWDRSMIGFDFFFPFRKHQLWSLKITWLCGIQVTVKRLKQNNGIELENLVNKLHLWTMLSGEQMINYVSKIQFFYSHLLLNKFFMHSFLNAFAYCLVLIKLSWINLQPDCGLVTRWDDQTGRVCNSVFCSIFFFLFTRSIFFLVLFFATF